MIVRIAALAELIILLWMIYLNVLLFFIGYMTAVGFVAHLMTYTFMLTILYCAQRVYLTPYYAYLQV